jgi:hypothetical protein
LDPGDGPAWQNKTTGWFGAHGVKAIFPLANALVKLNEEGTKLLPSHPDDPSMEDFGMNGKGMLATLVKVSESDFCASINLPSEDELRGLTKGEVRTLFNGFVRVSEQISYLLTKSATAKTSLSSMIPNIFDSPDSASRKDSISHPYVGFIQLLQIEKRLSRDPQGTALQMKDKLISDIKSRKFKGEDMKMHNLGRFVQDTSTRLTNILQKQPTLKVCMEMEVNAAFCSAVRSLCRDTAENSRKLPTDLVDAAEMIALDMTQKARTLTVIDWDNFSTGLLSMIAIYLPPEKINPKETDHVKEAVALHANSSYEGRQKQQSFQNREPPRTDWYSWTCSTCGNKGHHQKTCTNPPNPKAEKLVLLAKEEAAVKRKEKIHLKGKRRRIQEATEQPTGNEASPSSPTKKSNTAKNAGSKEKPVTAGLARLNLHDDSHGNGRSNDHAEYC